MPADVRIGQKCSAWVPSRGQWLLTTVIRRDGGQVVLQYDVGYGIARGHDEQRADEAAMLENSNLFRRIEP
jgi:hypothetical protein